MSFLDEFYSVNAIVDFASLLSAYYNGFTMIIEPYPEEDIMINRSRLDPLLQLFCLDSRIAMKNIFSKYRNVILTSGSLSPIDVLPKLLGFKPVLAERINIKLPRNLLNPIIISKGVD